jgi:hypothetical protein
LTGHKTPLIVMAGLVPAIYVVQLRGSFARLLPLNAAIAFDGLPLARGADRRDKPDHDVIVA